MFFVCCPEGNDNVRSLWVLFSIVLFVHSQECGWPLNKHFRQPRFRTSVGRIISGQESSSQAWPWQVSLQFLHPKFGFVGHWCGGVLIHPQWLLSAAHCVHNDAFNLPIAALWTAVLGDWNRAVDDIYKERIPVEQIIIHERFHHYQHDIVLMKLTRPANLTRKSRVRLICPPDIVKQSVTVRNNENQNNTSELIQNLLKSLSTTKHRVKIDEEYISKNNTQEILLEKIKITEKQIEKGRPSFNFTECVATGWGKSQESGELTDTLHEATIPVHDNSLCRKMYGSFVPIRSGHLCAGNLDGSSGTCVGDSGGPLQCRLPDGRWFLAGITSFGSGCAKPGYPDVYTRMSHYMTWVRTKIKDDLEEIR